ncbi:MAG: hypothetical protein J7J82_05975 [Staphylothermus sp.]|nr:hypothetical protein [Staphylothermus sp.]
MLWRKESLDKRIKKLIDELVIAKGHYMVARNSFEKHVKTRSINPLTLVSALQGIPFTYETLGNIYVVSGDKKVRGIIKGLTKIKSVLEKNYPSVAISLSSKLQNIVLELEKVLETSDLGERIKLLDNIVVELTMVRDKILLLVDKFPR